MTLEAALARLSDDAVPLALGGIDDAVFSRIDAARGGPVQSLRIGALAALGAVSIGLASVGLAPSPAQATPLPLDGSTALAPSSLLSGLLR